MIVELYKGADLLIRYHDVQDLSVDTCGNIQICYLLNHQEEAQVYFKSTEYDEFRFLNE